MQAKEEGRAREDEGRHRRIGEEQCHSEGTSKRPHGQTLRPIRIKQGSAGQNGAG